MTIAQIIRPKTRPVLQPHEAQLYVPENYFHTGGSLFAPDATPRDPKPIDITQMTRCWTVGSREECHTIQQTINQAIATNTARQRIYIRIPPGHYKETVYIPHNAPAITLFGSGASASKVVISKSIDACFTREQYQQTVNSHGQYKRGDPAWSMYESCLKNEVISTLGSAVVWIQSNDVELYNLTIVNSLLNTCDSGDHQAVALRTDGDRIQIDQVSLISRQDTFFVNNASADNDYNKERLCRVLVTNSYIEGDIDYVFGRASAVFDQVHFHSVSSRGSETAYVFAPDTLADHNYGFLVQHCLLTTDVGFKNAAIKAKFGRAWDQGARITGYLQGETANGQVTMKHCKVDSGYDLIAPWGAAATTNRPFRCDMTSERSLNSYEFNRLWEYETQHIK